MDAFRNAVLAVLLSLGMVAAVSTPAAAGERISRGDAQAVLESFWITFTIESQTPTTAPGFGNGHFINLNSFHEGVHVCTLDWHTYGVGFAWEGTLQEAKADKALLDVEFLIDGELVESDVTAIKRVLTEFGLFFVWTYGALIEPGSLALGAHTLTTNFYYDGTFESVTGTFIVDAEGTGACL